MTRTLRLLAVAATAALALTGCGDAAGQTGAAATVGDERIPTSELQQLVERSLADPGAQQTIGTDRAGFERAALRRLISHEIVLAAAKSKGVSVDGADVDAVLDRFAAQSGGEEQLAAEAARQGIAKADLREALEDVALRDAIADELTSSVVVPDAALREAYQQNIGQYDQVRSAHILVASQAKAEQLLAAVRKDPSQFAALAKQFSTDTSNKDNGGDLGFQGRGALEKPFEAAIFGNKPGSFVIARTQFGYHVIYVIDRRTTTFEQAKPDLRRKLLNDDRQAALQALLLKTAEDLGVDVNPRFGAWDPDNQQVVAVDSNGVTKASPRPGDTAATAPPVAP